MKSFLVTFRGRLLAVGGSARLRDTDITSEVRQYDTTSDSWSVISNMRMKRNYCLSAVLPDNSLIVCGGNTPDEGNGPTVSIELASAKFRIDPSLVFENLLSAFI